MSEGAPSLMTQSWLWGSQIEVKKGTLKFLHIYKEILKKTLLFVQCLKV